MYFMDASDIHGSTPKESSALGILKLRQRMCYGLILNLVSIRDCHTYHSPNHEHYVTQAEKFPVE